MTVGRFQVMATLQAARGHVLGYRLDEAQSLGLDRAIFYAAAKRGFTRMVGQQGPCPSQVPGDRTVIDMLVVASPQRSSPRTRFQR